MCKDVQIPKVSLSLCLICEDDDVCRVAAGLQGGEREVSALNCSSPADLRVNESQMNIKRKILIELIICMVRVFFLLNYNICVCMCVCFVLSYRVS